MKTLLSLVLLFVTACAPQSGQPTLPSQAEECGDLYLKTLWRSTTDSESHNLTNLPFTFLYVPYSYTGSNGAVCNAQMRWFMFTPAISGSSFKMELQGDSCGATAFYIVLGCNEISLCNDSFTSCKAFRDGI